MKISMNWLRQLIVVPEDVTTQELAHRLTSIGLEVEEIQTIGDYIRGVVVAEVRGVRKHPTADRLRLVDVFDGHAVTQVVCGAPNVPAPESGQYVLWARPQATLPGGITLQAKEVRGVLSPGMLCSATELGLAKTAEGLLLVTAQDGAVPGMDASALAGLPDEVLTLNVTPNRPDCLGHWGVARELVVALRERGVRWKEQSSGLEENVKGKLPLSLHVEDVQACPRYLAWWLEGVHIHQSPWRTQLLLERLGIHSVSNVVDSTQLSMLLWGQPLHAFDAGKIKGSVRIRKARLGEQLVGLDGQSYDLLVEDLVVADEEGPIALAGILGGKRCAISADTTMVLLESAYFDPIGIRRTSKRLKLHTEASHRFERGTDPLAGVERAGWEAVKQVCTTAHARSYMGPWEFHPRPFQVPTLVYDPREAERLLGASIPLDQQETWLQALGCDVQSGTQEEFWLVTVPGHRLDITRAVDLIEEVGRLWGYDHIPNRLPTIASLPEERTSSQKEHEVADRARDLCMGLGLVEIQTLPFTSLRRHHLLGWRQDDPRAHLVPLHNPLREELSMLRGQLSLDLLDAVHTNQTHQRDSIRMFEIAEVFSPHATGEKPAHEQTRLAIALAGRRDMHLQKDASALMDIFDLSGILEQLLLRLGCTSWELCPALSETLPWLHPGVAGVVVDKETHQKQGEFGEVHPDLLEKMDLQGPVYVAEINLPKHVPDPARFVSLPKFPAIERDLSFFVEETKPVQDILHALYTHKPSQLVKIHVVEDYREPGRVPIGQKGLLFRLVYRSPDKTLTDEEVQQLHQALVNRLQETVTIVLRV